MRTMKKVNRMKHDIEWRVIEGYNKLYEVSNNGEVKNTTTGRKLRSCKSGRSNKYRSALLYNNGKRGYRKIHRLVYEAFVGAIPNGMQIDHINGVHHDNRPENLRCVTQSENQSE